MKEVEFGGRKYKVDGNGFLADGKDWDEDFAIGMAQSLGIERLTDRHWEVIEFIRETFANTGACPLVYETCRSSGLGTREFKKLFPTGYLRGACKLAGVTYNDRVVNYFGEAGHDHVDKVEVRAPPRPSLKWYKVDALGFLLEPAQWDEDFAIGKAFEMGMRPGLTERHWQIVHFLRGFFEKSGQVPYVFDVCEAMTMDLTELERLFPQGYHRGAVKIAGLRFG